MDLLIVHYHLNPGGVTRIIQAQIEGLLTFMKSTNISVVCGSFMNPAIQGPVSVHINDLLGYHERVTSKNDFFIEVTNIENFLRSKAGSKTIIHCHNPNLGKNPALTMAIYNMAKEGANVVNHFHDFPEERPANIELINRTLASYTAEKIDDILYPVLPGYHYVVLNSCDYILLKQKGIPPERVHLLPNPVMPAKSSPVYSKQHVHQMLKTNPHKLLVTYPVRAIRRKNLGEFILLAALFSEKAEFAVTLAPLNPAELPDYNQWKMFCKENQIRIVFEASELTDYESLISASDFCITTSKREGFGMTYLEPWISGIPVVGRELECIVNDLKDSGVSFPRLYNRINTDSGEGMADFMGLSVREQQNILCRFKNHGFNKLISDNPTLIGLLDPVSKEIIEANKNIILHQFSTESYGRKLFELYQEIIG